MAVPSDPLIIRKRPRGTKQGAHGGAWKVAFADFTLAMMALFMVLWIIQVADQKEREMVVQYINGDLFAAGEMNPFDISNSPSLIDLQGNMQVQPGAIPTHHAGTDKAGASLHVRVPEGEKQTKAGLGPKLNSLVPGEFATQAQLELLARELDQVIESAQMGANVALQVVPQGIRILIHDSDKQAMFKLGQAQMQPYFEDLLMALAPLLGKVKNGLTISGHTDALPYVGRSYTNWELSSDRALIARQTLEYSGVAPAQLLQVTGMAARMPLIPQDPYHAKNRRIEIMVLTREAAEELTGLLTGQMLPKAHQAAQMNQPKARYPGATSVLEQ
ncbi:flagellar motor protein MotB [Shewanella sp. GXUN23E]|uniref:flagellar motor protein MotB n=1 Tax=Shewanella sp. GXUN23E TaxID=3422498 RepID=UPI003D7DC70C